MNKAPRQLSFFEKDLQVNMRDHLHMLQDLPVPRNHSEEITIELTEPPTNEDLYAFRKTLTQDVEYGLACRDGRWSLTKGQPRTIMSLDPQTLSPGDLFLHTHPYEPSEGPFDFSLPSPLDVVVGMSFRHGVVCGIISGAGLTLCTNTGPKLEDRSEFDRALGWYDERLGDVKANSPDYRTELLKVHQQNPYLDLRSYPWGAKTEAFLNWYLRGGYYVQTEFGISETDYTREPYLEARPLRLASVLPYFVECPTEF